MKNPFPPKEEIQSISDKLGSLNFSKIGIEDIKTIIKPLFNNYFISTYRFEAAHSVYRAIKYSTKPNILKDLSYPPLAFAKINRVNREGVQFFYCSLNKQTLLYELDLNIGDRIVISEWSIAKPLLVNNVGYTHNNFFNLHSKRSTPEFHPEKGHVLEEFAPENILIKELLAKNFSRKVELSETDFYKLTIAIAEFHLSINNTPAKDSAKFRGLLYPSIKANANEDNLAMQKETIDEGFLIFEAVEYLEIINIVDGKPILKLLDFADQVHNETLLWKNLPSKWIVEDVNDFFLVDEESVMVAYDSNGERIEVLK